MAELEQSKIIDEDVIFAVNECDWKVSMTTTLKTWREVLDINIQLAEGLKPECLLKLYDLLISLSVDSLSRCPGEKFSDIRKMSNFLFEELSGRFEHLFSNVGQHILCSDSWGLLQELTLLLRCCISMLHLLEFDRSLLIEKCQILLSILRILCSPELASTAGRKGKSVCITSVSVAFLPVLHSVIECTRNYEITFLTLETVSSTSDNLFMDPLYQGSRDVVLELISSHFLLSVSDEPTFKNSLEPFLLLCDEKPPFLDLISLNAAMQLLSTVVIYSPPQILQAHMISLVSRCCSISMDSYNQASDPRLVNWYISAFEISVDLYSQNMSSLQLGDTHGEPKSGFGFSDKQCTAGGLSHLSFDSHIRLVMYSQLKVHTTNFPTSVHLLPSKTKSDYRNTCIAYMKENQNILNVSSRDESFSVLSNIISRILSGDIGTSKLWKKGNISQQKMYLLASIVNLMSSSLLQTIWAMQKEVWVMLKCEALFSHYPQSICTLVADVMAHYPARHKHSKMMFMHFASLLLFSFEAGLEFLSKSCILMLMTLMNLFNLEKGILDALKHLEVESLSSPRSNESLVVTSSSLLKSLGLYARALQKLDF
ncbi:hypothetical protein MKW92_010438 [Papaver armeniacum]|nr:hypothetical protein MKW92_010438 [Papaver armeniacum]